MTTTELIILILVIYTFTSFAIYSTITLMRKRYRWIWSEFFFVIPACFVELYYLIIKALNQKE